MGDGSEGPGKSEERRGVGPCPGYDMTSKPLNEKGRSCEWGEGLTEAPPPATRPGKAGQGRAREGNQGARRDGARGLGLFPTESDSGRDDPRSDKSKHTL